jgi:hypothetical protein
VFVYVESYLQIKEQNCFQKLCKEKHFEMSTVELLDYKAVLVRMY